MIRILLKEGSGIKPEAVHIAADTGGHPVQIDQPKLLAAIVQAVLEAARDRSGLSIAAAVVKDAGGTLLR